MLTYKFLTARLGLPEIISIVFRLVSLEKFLNFSFCLPPSYNGAGFPNYSIVLKCWSLPQDSTILMLCVTVFLSYLPEAGQVKSWTTARALSRVQSRPFKKKCSTGSEIVSLQIFVNNLLTRILKKCLTLYLYCQVCIIIHNYLCLIFELNNIYSLCST